MRSADVMTFLEVLPDSDREEFFEFTREFAKLTAEFYGDASSGAADLESACMRGDPVGLALAVLKMDKAGDAMGVALRSWQRKMEVLALRHAPVSKERPLNPAEAN